MTAHRERALLLATPVVATAAVALGLRLGAAAPARAAIVYGASPSAAGTGLAWQVVAFDESAGGREPLARAPLEVTCWLGAREAARWTGATNEDGVAEALLPVARGQGLRLEVRSGRAVLAEGLVEPEALRPRRAVAVWMPFARRLGPVALDVAVLGGRAPPGFPASIWIRATMESTHAMAVGADIDLRPDESLSFARPKVTTDSRGWAEVDATPTGLATSLSLTARSAEGLTGEWIGGLQAAPGAAWLRARERYGEQERPDIEVVAPGARTETYFEIDDANGRAWATTLHMDASDHGAPEALAKAPRLAPGLYWAVAATDPSGAEPLAPSTSVRPFFVARSDEAALAMGTDAGECLPPRDVREMPRALASCLALAAFAPVPRWVALDGFVARRAIDRGRRDRGLAVAMGALAVAALLEVLLLLRAASRSADPLREELPAAAPSRVIASVRVGRVALALFISLLGFALFAAFLFHAA